MNRYKLYLESYGEIDEMRVVGDRNKDHVIAFGQNVYMMDGESDADDYVKIIDDLNSYSHKNFDYDDFSMGDLDEFQQELIEKVPDVLIGTINGSKLNMTHYDTFKLDPKSSILAKKVVKALNLSGISYEEDMNGSETTVPASRIKGTIPNTGYHGTTTEYLREILRVGIRPSRKESNWKKQNIIHPDKIFFSTQIGMAQGHSVMTAKKQGGFPMIIEFEIPDKSKIIADYDVETSTGKPETYVHKHEYPHGKPLKTRPRGVSQEYGVYGYQGSIPPKFIETIHVALEDPDDVYGLDQYTEYDASDIDELLRELYPDEYYEDDYEEE